MSQLDLISATAAEHVRDLRATAARGRLAALAQCCRPVWEQGVHRVRAAAGSALAWLRRDQLGRVENYCAC